MRASIVRAERRDRALEGLGSERGKHEVSGGGIQGIDALLDAVAGLGLKQLSIEPAHGKTVIRAVARYHTDREQLFDVIKQLDGWESDIVIDVEVERQDVRGYHTVQEGETLASIAERYFGSPSREMAIFEANRDRMNDPDQIFPGQQLLIPRR